MGPERRKVFEMHRFLSHQFQLRDRGLKAASKSGQRYQESVKRRYWTRDPAQACVGDAASQGFSGGRQAASCMFMRNILIGAFAAATLLVTGIAAQHDEHHPDQATPADKSAAMPMMASHAEVAQLAEQLVTSFAAIEKEKNGKARDEKLAEHGKLLKELQAKLQGQMRMMEHMHSMMMGEQKKQ